MSLHTVSDHVKGPDRGRTVDQSEVARGDTEGQGTHGGDSHAEGCASRLVGEGETTAGLGPLNLQTCNLQNASQEQKRKGKVGHSLCLLLGIIDIVVALCCLIACCCSGLLQV